MVPFMRRNMEHFWPLGTPAEDKTRQSVYFTFPSRGSNEDPQYTLLSFSYKEKKILRFCALYSFYE